ncbi:ATP-binding protein [Candidatus Saccharibacteria bacterium]|nr:ATP-binding protein [Candidatus Saccharibacteria bacterium]
MANTNTQKVEITSEGIRKLLKTHSIERCISEYIWNGFDAKASVVKISYEIESDDVQSIRSLTIEDNGIGINYDELAMKFKPVLVSQKQSTRNDLVKGKNGYGRFSFDNFAQHAQWKTIYEKDSKKYAYSIDIDSNNLIGYKPSDVQETEDEVGTSVSFVNLKDKLSVPFIENNLKQYLTTEFSWYLEVRKDFKIIINGSELDISGFIADQEDFFIEIENKGSKLTIPCKYRRWNKRPNDEYSRFYFLNNDLDCKMSKTTLLNNKRDGFWHSLVVVHDFFNKLIASDDEENIDLFEALDDRNIFKEIVNKLNSYLKDKRKPFLKGNASKVVYDLKTKGLIPPLEQFGIYDEESFDDLLKVVYTISPSSFVGKNDNDKKFFCATIASLLSSQEDNLIQLLLEQVQNLTEDEKKDLQDILKRTSLSNVVRTIKEIDHRLDVIEKLKELLFIHVDDTLEVKHLQKILDENFWIFGEQFRLFSTTEGPLHQTLKKYAKDILGIEDPGLCGKSRKELDLFLTKTELNGQGVGVQKNIIVELKRPNVTLGKEQYDQIEKYMETIKSQPACNGVNQYWEFYLIGDDYNEHIEDKIDSAKNHGESKRGLAHFVKDGRFKIYVRKWSDILEAEWGVKMKCLKEKLEIKAKPMPETPQEITDSAVK